jgi:hypothetical protein
MTSKSLAAKNKKFHENVTKRGVKDKVTLCECESDVKLTSFFLSLSLSQPKAKSLPVGPVVLGFFLFVVFGSGTKTIDRERERKNCFFEGGLLLPDDTLFPLAVLQIIRATEA